MTQLLRESPDQLLTRSDNRREDCFRRRPAQTPSQPAAPVPVAGVSAARLLDRALQAVWPAGLSLRQRTGPWAQMLSVHQHHRGAAANGLCAQRRPCRNPPIPRQFPQGPGGAQRDLRDQCGVAPPPRAVRINGSGRRRPRPCPGGHHPRQHDRILSCHWCAAVRTGGKHR